MDAQGALTQKREVKKVAMLVFASNSSLCGGFNANVLKMMQRAVDGYKEKGIEVVVYPIGRKVAEKVGKLGIQSAGNFAALADKPNSHECVQIGLGLADLFVKGEIDKVEMIYHHFKSAGSQILQTKTLIPIDIEEAMDYDHTRDLKTNVVTGNAQDYLEKQGGHKALDGTSSDAKAKTLHDNYIVEPDRQTVLNLLIPRYVNLMIYTALLDSNASEHAARMVAMQTATDNADELLRLLNLQYNKSRQQAITSELLDIVGGSVNN
jgi:F-type H+-transporting ATPase subunit gamma